MTGQPDGHTQTWDRHASWWQREFTRGADPEYEEQILPLAARELDGFARVLDVGCGEGQVARRIASLGAAVTGVDPSGNQIGVARSRGEGPSYASAVARALPLAADSFDAAIACLVLEHVDDLDEAVRELARVLLPGGRFILMLNHPLLQTPDSGWVHDHTMEPPERYWRVGAYLEERAFTEEASPGVFVRFVHRPLSRYVNAFAEAGFALVHMEEPSPPSGFLRQAAEYAEAAHIPRLLVLRFERLT